MGDFNGHNYLWGSHDVDTRCEVIERFTDQTVRTDWPILTYRGESEIGLKG